MTRTSAEEPRQEAGAATPLLQASVSPSVSAASDPLVWKGLRHSQSLKPNVACCAPTGSLPRPGTARPSKAPWACPPPPRTHLPGLDLRPVQKGLPHPQTWAPAPSHIPDGAAFSRFAGNSKVSCFRGSRRYRFCLGWKSNEKPFTAHFWCCIRGAQSGSTATLDLPRTWGEGAERGGEEPDRCGGPGQRRLQLPRHVPVGQAPNS